MRSGRAFLESLGDGRAVFLDGERVKDVTTHPGFAEPLRQIARMYDLARDEWDPATTTYVEPATGQRTSAMWRIPRSSADLALRRQVHRAWCQPSGGAVGGGGAGGGGGGPPPAGAASILVGFAAHPDVFARGGQAFADNLLRFY